MIFFCFVLNGPHWLVKGKRQPFREVCLADKSGRTRAKQNRAVFLIVLVLVLFCWVCGFFKLIINKNGL